MTEKPITLPGGYERPVIIGLNSRELTRIVYLTGASCLPESGGSDEDGGEDL